RSDMEEEAVEFGAAVAGEPAVLQGIAVGVADRFPGRSGVSGEVAFAGGIAPLSPGIPVPGLQQKLGVFKIADRAPACGQDLFQLIGAEEHVGGVAGYAV